MILTQYHIFELDTINIYSVEEMMNILSLIYYHFARIL